MSRDSNNLPTRVAKPGGEPHETFRSTASPIDWASALFFAHPARLAGTKAAHPVSYIAVTVLYHPLSSPDLILHCSYEFLSRALGNCIQKPLLLVIASEKSSSKPFKLRRGLGL